MAYSPEWMGDLTKHANNPIIVSHTNEEDYSSEADGTNLSTLGYTKTTKWAGANMEVVTKTVGDQTKALELDSIATTAYLRDDDQNGGSHTGFRFEYSSGRAGVGIIINGSEDENGFSGYLAYLPLVSGSTHYCKVIKYVNDTATTLYSSSNFTLSANTLYEFAAVHTGSSIAVTIYNIDTRAAVIGLGSGEADDADEFRLEGASGVWLEDSNSFIAHIDHTATSWFVQQFVPITNNGDFTDLYQDDDGYYWGAIQAGNSASADTIIIGRSSSASFIDIEPVFEGVAGRIGQICQLEDSVSNGSYDLQQPTVMYDTDAGRFELWCMANHREVGYDNYKIRHYYCSPDANGAPQTTQWSSSGNVLSSPLCWRPSVIKKTVNYGGTDYDYQMIYQPHGYSNRWNLAYSNNKTSWTNYSGNPVYQSITNYPAQLGYLETEGRYFVSCGASSVNRLYVSSNLTSWTLDRDNILGKGTSGEWDDARAGGLRFYEPMPGYRVAFYGGGAESTPPWDHLYVGLAYNGTIYSSSPSSSASSSPSSSESPSESSSPSSSESASPSTSPSAGDVAIYAAPPHPRMWRR